MQLFLINLYLHKFFNMDIDISKSDFNETLAPWIAKTYKMMNMHISDVFKKNKLYVFLVCLAISIFIWLLIVLSKNNIETIDYPITYSKPPDNLVLTNVPDSLLSFRLSSSGF